MWQHLVKKAADEGPRQDSELEAQISFIGAAPASARAKVALLPAKDAGIRRLQADPSCFCLRCPAGLCTAVAITQLLLPLLQQSPPLR
jgi:hypothetical protein